MARRKNHGRMHSVGDLAGIAVSRIVPADRLRLLRVQIAWPEVTRGHLAEVAWPAALRREVLTIHVVDNQWLHELTYLRADLLVRLQHHCEEAKVAEIRLRVGPVEPLPLPPEPPPPTPVYGLPDEPAPATLDALREVEDPMLKQAMANARMALSARVRGSS